MVSPAEGCPPAGNGGGVDLVGAAVRKKFGRVLYSGRVASYDHETQWYLVEYEDGDREELGSEELLPLLQPPSLAATAARRLAAAAAGAAQADGGGDAEAADDGDGDGEEEKAPADTRSRKRRGPGVVGATAADAPRRVSKRSRPPPRRRARGSSSEEESGEASGGSGSGSDESGGGSGGPAPWEDDGLTEEEAPASDSSSEEEEVPLPPPPPQVAKKAGNGATKKAKGPCPGAAGAAGADGPDSDGGGAAAPDPAAAFARVVKAKAAAKAAAKNRVAGPPLTPGPAADAAVKACRAEFQRLHLLAVRSEEERFTASGGRGPDGKRLSKRPDLVAFTALKNSNGAVNQRPVMGHVPGIAIGLRFYGRAEVAAVGLHRHWLSGISYAAKKESPFGCVVATSIVVSGGYEDDQDNGTDLTYTGQGGNDLLGRKKQLADQRWDRGNVAMRNAQERGVPVRVIRGNPDKHAPYGRVFIYDGLYDITAFEEKVGVSGYKVIKFQLRRQALQPALTSNTVAFGHASLPAGFQVLRRPGLVDDDISRGAERLPVVAVNEVDDALPPCTRPSVPLALRARARAEGLTALPAPRHADASLTALDAAWTGPSLRYTAVQEYAPTAPRPPPPATGCSCVGSCGESAHCACAALNVDGELAYVDEGKGRPVRLVSARALVRECGPACSCPPGCANRVTQRGLRHRLEVFRTADGRGWGVRSWDTIAAGEYVCTFVGTVVRDEDIEEQADGADIDDTYIFNMRVATERQAAAGDGGAYFTPVDEAEVDNAFCVDASAVGSVARFINHSCAPNLFVQPVLGAEHASTAQAAVCFFAAECIPPLTELAYDYGPQYVREKLEGDCRCAAAECVGKVARAAGAAAGAAGGAAGTEPSAPPEGPFRLPQRRSGGTPTPSRSTSQSL